MGDPFRRVLRYEPISLGARTGYVAKSNRLIVECGHHQIRKMSQVVPDKVRCRDCGHLERGGYSKIGDVVQKPWDGVPVE